MGRVSDYHVRFRHIGHHPPLGNRPLLLTDPPFNMRVAFLIFEFVADILFGHLQFFEVAPQLIKNVKRHHRRQSEHHQKTAVEDHLQRIGQRVERLLGHQMQHRRPVVPQVQPGYPADQRGFEYPF